MTLENCTLYGRRKNNVSQRVGLVKGWWGMVVFEERLDLPAEKLSRTDGISDAKMDGRKPIPNLFQ